MKRFRIFILSYLMLLSGLLTAQTIFIEAESLENHVGWVIDQQSMDQMGSPYLMAHGLGVPVEESRRLMGDIVLKEQDILNKVEFPDASFTTTWTIDLHYPVALEGFEEEPFLSKAQHTKIDPYAVPYRCLYSKNINNLFMAGRNISVTHVALGTVRVMRTTGMMGEVVGMAASLAIENNTNPRGVYQQHLDELKQLMTKGIGEVWY